jgi:ABC-type transporter Mla subunit MlaD
MGSKANPVWVGLFVVIGFVGMVLFSLWFAKFSFTESQTFYSTRFPHSVAGLKEGALVRYKGVVIGTVDQVSLENDMSSVRVRIKIPSSFRLHSGVKATLDVQPVTGLSTIQLNADSQSTELLSKKDEQGDIIIPVKPSFFENLTLSAPDLLGKVNYLLENINTFVSSDNAKRFQNILKKIEFFIDSIDGNFSKGDVQKLSLIANKAYDTLEHIDKVAISLHHILKDNRAHMTQFMSSGLPAATRFLHEATHAADALGRIANSIEQSPRRFLTNDTSQGYALP